MTKLNPLNNDFEMKPYHYSEINPPISHGMRMLNMTSYVINSVDHHVLIIRFHQILMTSFSATCLRSWLRSTRLNLQHGHLIWTFN